MNRHLYAGTYTQDNEANDTSTGSAGIYHFLFDTSNGTLTPMPCRWSVNPSFLTIGFAGTMLYAAGELMSCDTFSAFQIHGATGALEPAALANLRGDWACHLSVCEKVGLAAVSHYWSGSLTTIQLDKNHGAPIRVACDLKHTCGDIDPEPKVSRVHSSLFSPDGRFLYAADLGLKRVYNYRVDAQSGWLTPNDAQPFLQMPNDEAPRHMAIHPNGQIIYLVTESDSHLISLRRDERNGVITPVDRVSTLPAKYCGDNMASDVRVCADGRFVYAANRGHNSIACFRADDRGAIESLGCDSCMGNWPRSFCLEETHGWIIIANQFSGEIVVRRLDGESGRLGAVSARQPVPRVACVQLL